MERLGEKGAVGPNRVWEGQREASEQVVLREDQSEGCLGGDLDKCASVCFCVCGKAGFKEEGVVREAERRSRGKDWWGGRRWESGSGVVAGLERGWARKGPRDLEKREKGRWPDGSLVGATRIGGERDQKEEEIWVRVFRVWGF